MFYSTYIYICILCYCQHVTSSYDHRKKKKAELSKLKQRNVELESALLTKTAEVKEEEIERRVKLITDILNDRIEQVLPRYLLITLSFLSFIHTYYLSLLFLV